MLISPVGFVTDNTINFLYEGPSPVQLSCCYAASQRGMCCILEGADMADKGTFVPLPYGCIEAAPALES